MTKQQLSKLRWRLANKDYMRRYCKKWYKENRIRLRKYSSLWERTHPEAVALKNARRRCDNPNHKSYINYGGRGIRCLITAAELLTNIGPRPSSTYSLDRINNDGNYEVGNIRWATRKQQAANSRSPWIRRRRVYD